MITREELRELSQFRFNENEHCAISFYFQPVTPRNKAHREEAILAKDLVRKTIQELQLNGRDKDAIADLEKILQLAEGLHGNQARAKAIFARSVRRNPVAALMRTIGPEARATAKTIGQIPRPPSPRGRLMRRKGTSASIGVVTRMMM